MVVIDGPTCNQLDDGGAPLSVREETFVEQNSHLFCEIIIIIIIITVENEFVYVA